MLTPTPCIPIWVDKNSMANTMSHALLADQHRITHDNAAEDAFNMHAEKGIVKFERTSDNLCAHRLL